MKEIDGFYRGVTVGRDFTVVAFVGEQPLGLCDGDRHQRIGSGVIRRFAPGQDEAKREVAIVASGPTTLWDFARKAAG